MSKTNIELTMRLEVVPIPVTDIDRAKAFYGHIEDIGGVKYSAYSDPDGNTWTPQEIPQEM